MGGWVVGVGGWVMGAVAAGSRAATRPIPALPSTRASHMLGGGGGAPRVAGWVIPVVVLVCLGG